MVYDERFLFIHVDVEMLMRGFFDKIFIHVAISWFTLTDVNSNFR